MKTGDIIALVSAVIAAASLLLAFVEARKARKLRISNQEKLVQLTEILSTATSGAETGAAMADMIVQRAKQRDVSIQELQSLARSLRGSLTSLQHDLEKLQNSPRAFDISAFQSGKH